MKQIVLNKVYVPQPAFKPDFSKYIGLDHKPGAVFDPKKTAVLMSYHSREDRRERVLEAVDPRDLEKGHGHERR